VSPEARISSPPPSTKGAAASLAEVEAHLRCEAPRPAPLFLPAIYEHKAWFLQETPSRVCQSADLLTRALLAEFETIGPDALTVGIDVYNVEAEAAGGKVTFYGEGNTGVPGIEAGGHAIRLEDDVAHRPIPNPLTDGRMPVFIEAARRVVKELGPNHWVRGAVSGPFSLATSLVGTDDFFPACLEEPDRVHAVLAYAARIIKEFAKAYIDAGVGLVMFDSQASPAMISRQAYEEFVLPVTTDLIRFFAEQGVRNVPLIIGGNTTPIIDLLIQTGANNLICDVPADWEKWSAAVRKSKRAIRRNLSHRLIETGTPDAIYLVASKAVSEGHDLPGFIMGTAVIPYGTPTQNILAIKQACLDGARSVRRDIAQKK
jgi:uroporphyrinogen decarboxylase